MPLRWFPLESSGDDEFGGRCYLLMLVWVLKLLSLGSGERMMVGLRGYDVRSGKCVVMEEVKYS